MKHSVIIGSYNRPVFVSEAIRSVFEQTMSDWELIVTDDGSNEETLSAIRAALKGDPRTKLVTFPRSEGVKDCFNRAVHAINRAIPLVTGQIVHYLADDDLLVPKRFERFEEMFRQRPEAMCCYGRLIYVDYTGVPEGSLWIDEADMSTPLCHIDQGQFAHRREVFDTYPKWDDAIDTASDGWWMQKLFLKWGRFRGFDMVVFKKRRHMFNMQKDGGGEKREGNPPPISPIPEELKHKYD